MASMNRRALWLILRTEGGFTLSALALGLIIGGMVGGPRTGAALAMLAVLGRHLFYAARLVEWQNSPKKCPLPDGSGIWVPLYDGAMARYRQARKRKKRLAAIVGEFRASTAALPDAAVVLDQQRHIIWFNAAANHLLGLRSSRDVGQRMVNLLRHPDFARYMREADDNAQAGIEIPHPEQAENTLWVRLIRYGADQKLLIARDVTDRKRLEAARRDFVSNASHELRTPLTVVSGYLEMLVDEAVRQPDTWGPWRDPLLEMRKQAVRMEQIISDMLHLARIEGTSRLVERVSIHMPRLLRDAVRTAEALSEGRHQFTVEIDESLRLHGQPAEIQSVVANLLSNAVRYTPAGGDISLRWAAQGSSLVLEVCDSGIGISPRDLPRLTERFYRADVARSRATGGTGLGLAIVKHVLERHEATLEIESTPGQGSCFRCRFSRGR